MASADPSSELRKVEEELAQVEQQISQLLQKRSDLERKRKFLKRDISQLNSVDEQTDWERSDFPWSKRLHESKESVFGINKLRPLQEKTMNVFLSGKDCILIMPTGGGKSLCFQLPAISSKGLTLVVCPLVSLMEDQIMSLHTLGIDAALLNSNSTKEEVNKINTALTDKKSTLKLLYVTPEKLAKSKRFMSKLEKSYEMGVLSRIVIDEVHCCSQWGHDFRPDYKFLGIMKRQFPKCPILGLTATATVHVVNDVKKMLNLSRCLLFTASFNRPNLYYEVYQKPSNASETLDSIQKIIFNQFKDQSGIVYCLTQKDCEEVTAGLQSRGIRAGCYHGNMDARQRSHVHRKWTTNDLQVVVATVAFGMGIDKANVRFVIHHSISKSMENYYQESGRAGRDDAKSHCILFYSFSDIARQSTMVFTEQTGLENLYKMVAYCNAVARCRRSMIAEHFNESWSESDCSGMCDACVKPGGILSKDVSRYCIDVMTIIEQAASKQIRITALKLIDAWNGKGATNLRNSKVKPPMLTRPSCEKLLVFMLLEGYLREDFHFTPYSTISYIVAGSRKVNDSQILLDFATKTKSGNSNSSQADSSQGLNESQGLNNSKQVNNAQRLNKPSKDLTEKTNSGERKQKQNISNKKRKSMKPVETTYDSDFDELDALNAPSKKKRKRKINTGNNSKISSSVEDECILLESDNEHDSYEGQQEKLSKDDVEVLWDSDESIDSTLHSVYEKQLEGLGVEIK